MKAIIAKFDPDKLLTAIQKEFDSRAKSAQKQFEFTTVNFQEVEPNFLIERSKKGGDLIWVIGPEDNQDGNIWMYLNEGTEVRYAILSPDWVSKTTPNTLSSGSGAGRVIMIRTDLPQPGIEARNWSRIIAEVEQKKFNKNIGKIIRTTKVFTN